MATKEAETDRTKIANFLKGQPEEWVAPSGALTGHERIERMSFASKYATPKFRGWLDDKKFSLEDFVDSHEDIDRVEFCEMLGGRWLDETEAVAG